MTTFKSFNVYTGIVLALFIVAAFGGGLLAFTFPDSENTLNKTGGYLAFAAAVVGVLAVIGALGLASWKNKKYGVSSETTDTTPLLNENSQSKYNDFKDNYNGWHIAASVVSAAIIIGAALGLSGVYQKGGLWVTGAAIAAAAGFVALLVSFIGFYTENTTKKNSRLTLA